MTRPRQYDFNDAMLSDSSHRPWPMRDSPWIMTQTWHDLLFAHWPIDADALRRHVPARFQLDLHDGRAWLGIVPFYMTNVAPRFVPAVPGLSAFPELNVRTYVRVGEKPGVFFFSLDAGNPLAVRTARGLLNLPYYTAAMQVDVRDGSVHYSSRRRATPAEFVGVYRPTAEARSPEIGSLDYFLTERYCLFAVDRQSRPYRLEIHHPRWRLHPAAADISVNTMADAAGIALPPSPPLLHFSARQDTVVWSPELILPV